MPDEKAFPGADEQDAAFEAVRNLGIRGANSVVGSAMAGNPNFEAVKELGSRNATDIVNRALSKR